MSSLRRYSRSAVKLLLIADLLIAVTALAFAVTAWYAELTFFSQLLATLFTGGVLTFVLPDAVRELRLLYSPRFERPGLPADD
jgi:hypothetical protein